MTVRPPDRLARRLGLGGATVIGLGSMMGAGIFIAVGPAAAAVGSGLLLALALAAAVATCNAIASARLAARYPASGGTYVYGRERLGSGWGFIAGWAFLAGKIATAATIALAFAAHTAPGAERPVAVAVVALFTAVNLLGITKTAWGTAALVAIVLAMLAITVGAMLGGGTATSSHLTPFWPSDHPLDLLRGAGFLFYAFAGYARIATLGEEVRHPDRTIPRAIALALVTVLGVYALVAISAILAAGPQQLAGTDTPILAAVELGSLNELAPAVRIGAAIAALSVLVALLAGISRTVFAMAANADLPPPLAAVHPRTQVPHRAELLVAALVMIAVAFFNLREALGFAAFTVLAYYAITNLSAWTLSGPRSLPLRLVATLGLIGCGALAIALPTESVISGAAVLAVGFAVWLIRRRLLTDR